MTTDRATQGWVADDSTFGARLALIRQRMHWGNVKEAAVACGLPVESWRSWERDGRVPQRLVEIASIIADRTGCDYGWLLTGPRLRGEAVGARSTHGFHSVALVEAIHMPRPPDNRPPGRPGPATTIGGSRTSYLPRRRGGHRGR